jgi:hypothetical protein
VQRVSRAAWNMLLRSQERLLGYPKRTAYQKAYARIERSSDARFASALNSARSNFAYE